jgi:hypothetical protein
LGLAVDDKYVCWTNTADGNVCRVEKTVKGHP